MDWFYTGCANRHPLSAGKSIRETWPRGAGLAAVCILISACGGGEDGSAPPAPPEAGPSMTLSASPTSAEYGSDVVLSWSTTNASNCAASEGWSGEQPVSGQETVSRLTASATFTLTCTGPGGSTHQSTTVTVASLPPDPGEAGNTTIAGADSDSDGVRDDVERYILMNTSPGGIRQTLIAQAKLFQRTLVETPQASMLTTMARNLECLYSYSPRDARGQSAKLLAEYLNTPERVAAYLNFAASVGAVTVDIDEPADFAKSCGPP